MKKKDYYDILNISKDATPEQIKKGYKRQAIRLSNKEVLKMGTSNAIVCKNW